jgi:ribonucleoside-diphosphate reductase alpha chain
LYESRSGERGVFSRVASQRQAAKNGRRDSEFQFGTNPCSEIILRPYQFCNLSEVVIRSDDTLASLKRKARVAAILGTLQATLTDFRYLRNVWKTNTEEEALLGVSLTGIMDHPVLSGREDKGKLKKWLTEMRNEAIVTNEQWAKKLGINPSVAITAVKPSGTVSQLVDSASGIHPRYSSQYIRRVRADSRDPLCSVLEAAGVPVEDDLMSPSTRVFSFPIASPEGAVTASDMGAMEQLDLWEIYQDYWCEHKPSMTCYYRDEEFLEVGQWLYNKFDKVSGISFLPYSDHTYQQAPYEPVDKKTYNQMVKDFPKEISWDIEEASDMTEGSQQLACTGNNCEL